LRTVVVLASEDHDPAWKQPRGQAGDDGVVAVAADPAALAARRGPGKKALVQLGWVAGVQLLHRCDQEVAEECCARGGIGVRVGE
jgi:hypothetical protein